MTKESAHSVVIPNLSFNPKSKPDEKAPENEISDKGMFVANNKTTSDEKAPENEIPDEGMFGVNNKTTEESLYNKKDLTPDEFKLLEFISDMKFKTLDTFLKAFGEMLERYAKMMDELKPIILKQEIEKKEMNKEEMKKEVLKEEILKEKV